MDFQISGSQIAYFATDNATNNDTALALISEHAALDPMASRVRRASHIFNLACTAILFEVDEKSLDDARYDFEDEELPDTQAVAAF
jgi:hypothetical protein